MIFLRRYKTYIKHYKVPKRRYHIESSHVMNHITVINIIVSIFGGITKKSQFIHEYFDCGALYKRDIICNHGKIPVIVELLFNNSENQRYGNYRYTQESLDLYNKLSNKKNIICNIKANIPKSLLKRLVRNLREHKISNINKPAIFKISASLYVNNQHRKTINYSKSFNS
jgi:hypothetical protein